MEVNNTQQTWANTDLVFLSSLVCAGRISGLTPLTSLTGLDNVVDGVPDTGASFFVFYFPYSSELTDVSALNAYARCGTPMQRPDGPGLLRLFISIKD